MDISESSTHNATNKDHNDSEIVRNSEKSSDIENPPEKRIKLIDEQDVEMNGDAGISPDQSEQNLRNGEADLSEKTEGSPSEMSSVKSEDDFTDETKQETEVLIKLQERELPTNSERRLDDTQVESIEPIEFGSFNKTEVLQEGELPTNSERRLDDTQVESIELTELENYSNNYEASESNVALAEKSSERRVEQAMENLKLVEHFQENGQYAEALSCCQSTLQVLHLSQDINLYMKFRSNIMQLYYLMENIDEAINTYYDHCVHVLESVSDPKVIQSILDLHGLCMRKLNSPTKGDEE